MTNCFIILISVCNKLIKTSGLDKLPSSKKQCLEVFPKKMNLLARNITNRFNQCEIIVDKLNNGIRNLNQVGIKLILLSFSIV